MWANETYSYGRDLSITKWILNYTYSILYIDINTIGFLRNRNNLFLILFELIQQLQANLNIPTYIPLQINQQFQLIPLSHWWTFLHTSRTIERFSILCVCTFIHLYKHTTHYELSYIECPSPHTLLSLRSQLTSFRTIGYCLNEPIIHSPKQNFSAYTFVLNNKYRGGNAFSQQPNHIFVRMRTKTTTKTK